MRLRLGRGGKSVMSGCFCMISFKSTSVGKGSVVAFGGTSSICPARTLSDCPGCLARETWALPSRTISLLVPARVDSTITVEPVIATVTAPVWMVPPPESFGTRRRSEPRPSSALRPPLLKLKTVLAPRRMGSKCWRFHHRERNQAHEKGEQGHGSGGEDRSSDRISFYLSAWEWRGVREIGRARAELRRPCFHFRQTRQRLVRADDVAF